MVSAVICMLFVEFDTSVICHVLVSFSSFILQDVLSSLKLILVLEGQSVKYSVNMLVTCINCDAGPGCLIKLLQVMLFLILDIIFIFARLRQRYM